MAHSTMASTAHTVLSHTPRGPHRALASVMPKPTHGATLPSTTPLPPIRPRSGRTPW